MNPPDTSESVGLLVTDIARLIRKLADRRLVAIGLTRAQCHALISLKRLGPLAQATLAEILEVETATIARLIVRLEASGWVERQPDARDRRSKIVSITDKATAIMDQIAEMARLLANDMLSDLTPADQDDLAEKLTGLKSRLTQLLGRP